MYICKPQNKNCYTDIPNLGSYLYMRCPQGIKVISVLQLFIEYIYLISNRNYDIA